MDKKINKASSDIFVSLVIYCIVAIFGSQLSSMPDTASWYPKILLAGVLVFNTIGLVQNIGRYKNGNQFIETAPLMFKVREVIKYTVICGLYIKLISTTGYFLTTLVFMFIMMLTIRWESKKVVVLLPILTTVAIYMLFTYVLNVFLPVGSLFR